MEMTNHRSLLILAAGVKGAIGSTMTLACDLLWHRPEAVAPYLTTTGRTGILGEAADISVAGWDVSARSMTETLRFHGVVSESRWEDRARELDAVTVLRPPGPLQTVADQVDALVRQIESLTADHPGAEPVFVNLLPACPDGGLDPGISLQRLSEMESTAVFSDLVYAVAAIRCGLPVVNFTPNDLALPALVREAEANGSPMAGRDGKTGQTYFKVVLASALKARNLYVDGWYSLNILGNADGENLMNPACAAGKLANKTDLLDTVLGYPVGERYGKPCHKVHIDYYPPRGDAKEAWDVIDVKGLFDLPMSLRLNLQGRDSILAAPMLIDLARWVAAAKRAGRGGQLPELGFYFKKPEGRHPPITFQEQMDRLASFEGFLAGAAAAGKK
ncbi:MAG: inositol-3-phosphate synthase [Desulfobacterales bacterium]